MYRLTKDPNIVVDITDNACIPIDADNYRSRAYADWLAAGNTPEPAARPTAAEVTAGLIVAIQQWLDAAAHENGYDSIATCVSYKDSGVAQWAADAAAALAWRDAVWQAAFAYQEESAANPPDPWPTAEQVIAQLPQPSTFGWTTHQPGDSGG